MRQFKLSNDPDFVAKLRDVVGLYVDPPAHAIVFSVDEKSQIQALDRTQPGLPMKKGRLGTMTHDDKRHGTTTLFAALNVLEGKVIGPCMQRHRHQEFIRFLNAIEADIPAGQGRPCDPRQLRPPTSMPRCAPGSAATERFTFHFVPTSSSWLNAVEGFFAKLSKRRLKRGVFRSIVDLQVAINRFLDETQRQPKALHLDRRSRQNHRRRQTRASSVRFDPLAANEQEGTPQVVTKALEAKKEEAPLRVLNELLKTANLPIEIFNENDEQIFAKKLGEIHIASPNFLMVSGMPS